MHRMRPAGMVRPMYYRRDRIKSAKHWLFEKFESPADASGAGPRLYDYYKMADYVKMLPTIKERIDFVNPYERPWNTFEKTWHRPWHAPLFTPRQAWAIPPVPAFFDTLNFYKYITKSRVLSKDEGRAQFDAYFSSTQTPAPTLVKHLESRLSENLACLLSSGSMPTGEALDRALRILFEDIFLCLSTEDPRINLLRISHTPRCESFWIRAGFKKLYKDHNVYTQETKEVKEAVVGDDRRLLGELSFTMRDKLISNCRSVEPIRNIFEWSDVEKLNAPVFSEPVDLENDVLFDPNIYRLNSDPDVLWQCPGYDYDVEETHKFGVVSLKDSSKLHKKLEYWKPDSEEETDEIRHDFYCSTALTSLFNWLNGQAHCIGHTQFTDIEKPLTSQLIISDGKEFCFAISQLNTIAINIDVEGFENNHTNLCCVDGPHNLYDEFDPTTRTFKHKVSPEKDDDDESVPLVDGFNPHVLKRLIQICSNYC